jgi:hypothetical protein
MVPVSHIQHGYRTKGIRCDHVLYMKKMILDASIAVNTLLALISMQDVDRRLARCHFLGKVRGTLIWRAMWEFTYCIFSPCR